MARNGSGTMVKTGDDAVFDTVISESYYNDQINDMINALTQSVSKDGQTTLTGNINAGSKKLTAMAVGTALTDSLTLGQAQNASMNYVASDTGGSNAAVIAPAPAITSYVAGQVFHFKAAANSSGATTLNVSGLGTKAVQVAGAAISGASITTAGITSVIYDGTQFQLMSEDASVSSGDVVGPGSATDNALTRYNGTTGKIVQNSGWALSDSNVLTAAGELVGADNVVSAINLKDYGEVTQALGSAGGTRTVDLNNGNSVTATVSASANTFVFSNPTAGDELCGFTLGLTNGGSQTVNWPSTVDWTAATAPTLTASGVDWLVFWTVDGGTIWNGKLVGAAFA
jgi:hypothetical protein